MSRNHRYILVITLVLSVLVRVGAAVYIGNETNFKPLLVTALLLNTLPGHISTFKLSHLKSLFIFHATSLVGTCIFAMILVRHLMIWKIFGPRMLFQLIQFGFYLTLYCIRFFLFRMLPDKYSRNQRINQAYLQSC